MARCIDYGGYKLLPDSRRGVSPPSPWSGQKEKKKKEVKAFVGKDKEKLQENNGHNSYVNILLRVLRTHGVERRHRHTLSPWTSILLLSFAFGLLGGGLLAFFWGFMCGFVPTLPQPLPALINWNLFIAIVVLAAAVDYSKTH